jgi:hypothetical protein
MDFDGDGVVERLVSHELIGGLMCSSRIQSLSTLYSSQDYYNGCKV